MRIIFIILTFLLVGCTTSEPKYYDLLFRENANNLTYKSVTEKDYKGEKEYN